MSLLRDTMETITRVVEDDVGRSVTRSVERTRVFDNEEDVALFVGDWMQGGTGSFEVSKYHIIPGGGIVFEVTEKVADDLPV